MGEYLLTGHNPAGRKVTEHIVASSADEAVEVLESRGFQDIVLHTDDVGGHYLRHSERQAVMSPREALSFHLLPGWLAGFLYIVGRGYRNGWGFYGLLSGMLIFRSWCVLCLRGQTWNSWDYLMLVLLALPIEFAVAHLLFFSRVGQHRKVLEAAAWGRWQEVLDRLPRIRVKLAPDALAFEKGKALAGLGRLEEALQVLKPFSDGVKMPEWLYWNRLGEVYAAAKQRDMMVKMFEHAVELAPENPTVLIGLASALVRERHDTRTARRLLDEARTHALSDLLMLGAEYAEGLILLEEGRPHDAGSRLEAVLLALRQFPSSPAMVGLCDRIHFDLAMARAGTGDTEEALKHFKRAVPRLQAFGRGDLIDKGARAIGVPIDA